MAAAAFAVLMLHHGGGSFWVGSSSSSSSSLDSDAWETNGNADEPIMHAVDVNNEEEAEIVMVLAVCVLINIYS